MSYLFGNFKSIQQQTTIRSKPVTPMPGMPSEQLNRRAILLVRENQSLRKHIQEKETFYLNKITELQLEAAQMKQQEKTLMNIISSLQLNNNELKKYILVSDEIKNMALEKGEKSQWQKFLFKIRGFLVLQAQVSQKFPQLYEKIKIIVQQYQKSMIEPFCQKLQSLLKIIWSKIQENENEKRRQAQLYRQTKKNIQEVLMNKHKEFADLNFIFSQQIETSVLGLLDAEIQKKENQIDKINNFKDKVKQLTQQRVIAVDLDEAVIDRESEEHQIVEGDVGEIIINDLIESQGESSVVENKNVLLSESWLQAL